MEEFQRDDSRQIIAVRDIEIIGLIIMRLKISYCFDNNSHLSIEEKILYEEAEILFIGVDPKLQNRGIGKILLDKIVKNALLCGAKKIWLEVRQSNDKAIEFYKKNNFLYIQIRKNYFHDPPENALIMKRDLG